MAEPSRSLEAFTADLAREAQALGIAPTNHLAAAREPQVSWRASMLPLVNYDDGTGGFGWPQMAVDAKNAIGRFGRSVNAALGEEWSPDETFPRPEDAVLPGLAMAGSGLGHLGLRGRVGGSVAGAERAEASSAPAFNVGGRNVGYASAAHEGGSGVHSQPGGLHVHGMLPGRGDMATGQGGASGGVAGRGPALYQSFHGPNGTELHLIDGGYGNAVFRIKKDGRPVGTIDAKIDGNTARIGNIQASSGANSLGVGGLRDIREAFRQAYPDVVNFESRPGDRISGARNGPAAASNDKTQKVTFYSNPKEGGLAAWLPWLGNRAERAEASSGLPSIQPSIWESRSATASPSVGPRPMGEPGPSYVSSSTADQSSRLSGMGGNSNVVRNFMDDNPSIVPAEFRGKAPESPVQPGMRDDTGAWFLEGDKPVYANASRESLDRLFGPEYAKRFDAYRRVESVDADGNRATYWLKPSLTADQIENVNALGRFNRTFSPTKATPEQKLQHDRLQGLAYGYDPANVERFVADKASGLPSHSVEAGRHIPEAAVLEPVAPGQGFGARNSGNDPMARARQSQHWPDWGAEHPERALYSTLEQEAHNAWSAAVNEVRRANPTLERWKAEAEVMQTRPELGFAYQDARRAWKEHDKGRPLTAGEEWWEGLDKLPGSPPDTAGLTNLMREKFMVMGHPELERRHLARQQAQAGQPQLPPPEAGSGPFSGPLTARAHHGTGGPLEGGKFDVGRSRDRLGIHFGTETQAQHFARVASDNPADTGMVYPADLNFRNAIEIHDQFTWRGSDTAAAIADAYPEHAGIRQFVAKAGDPSTAAGAQAQREAVRQYLLDNGIDGIRYHNPSPTEGVGTSYIAIGPDTVKSATTGETLFSNPKDAAPAGVLAAGQPNNALEEAKRKYPALRNLDIKFKRSARQGGPKLEFWPADEPGSAEWPRPKEFPQGARGIEVYSDDVSPLDILGDVVSHDLVRSDPVVAKHYADFAASLTPDQNRRLHEQYAWSRTHEGERRPFEQWKASTGLPAYFRGYPFKQWPDDFSATAYTPEQRRSLDEMMQYLTGPSPRSDLRMAPNAAPAGLLATGEGEESDVDILRKYGWLGQVAGAPIENYLRTARSSYNEAGDPTGPIEEMIPPLSFPSLFLTQDMMVPPQWTLNEPPGSAPVGGRQFPSIPGTVVNPPRPYPW